MALWKGKKNNHGGRHKLKDADIKKLARLLLSGKLPYKPDENDYGNVFDIGLALQTKDPQEQAEKAFNLGFRPGKFRPEERVSAWKVSS